MKKEDLRIVFMGTPEFAVETLQALVEHQYNVVAVVTQPDKPVGRHGSVLQPSAVKQYALSQGLPVLQPEKMKDPEFVEALRSYQANLQVVVAFRMLPEVVWAMPEYGTFNVHAALLPQYRGAAPINWAIINGETKTGVTTFFLDHDIDTGRIILQKPFDIPDTADVEYVYDGLMHLGAEICLETIEAIIASDGHPSSMSQDDSSFFPLPSSLLKPAPKLFKETCEINWQQSAKQVYDFIRGLSPIPGAWTTLVSSDGKETVLKIFKSAKTDRLSNLPPGQVLIEGKALYVACLNGELLQLLELQLAGKKRLSARDFLNGNQAIEKMK
ncbi:MAG: methionyl-tRNA formyltransferase [Prevotella sp.]|nr:methionyl-tRNA formyltransferase [Prevotella sp.]